MSDATNGALNSFMDELRRHNPHQDEFHQAVEEVAVDILPYTADKPIYRDMRILERMSEPDRVISFRVCWEDDRGTIQVNRGHRVQCNNAIGPYKGGIRFHLTVNLSILKFLAFEQTFKNSLTGLPLGGAKGGADFDPKGRSDAEIMRFCQSFMTELQRHIGPNTDVPAGDIGVGAREVGYLFGQYKRLTNRFEGVLTGKALEFGGSHLRPEATGYGVVYMMQNMLAQRGGEIAGKTCLVSGAGNVALYCVEKLTELGGKVVTLSDSGGFIHDPEGLTPEKLAWIMDLKERRRGRLAECEAELGCRYYRGESPWRVPAELVFPCATQNEIREADARLLAKNGCVAIAEGANMPAEPAALRVFQQARILLSPSKAANAGGVAVSGLEMSQNSLRFGWTKEEVDERLKEIITRIHDQCLEHGSEDGHINYLRGANIAGFLKVADAMLAYGVL